MRWGEANEHVPRANHHRNKSIEKAIGNIIRGETLIRMIFMDDERRVNEA